MVERRHRVIRELGMTMLFHSGIPLYLWVEVFSTAVYLINRLPSSALDHETPYFTLHGIHPDYTSLRVFGSKCFPYTWDTRKNKFDPKTVPCVFVGYSDKHKGYKCFHPSSKIFFISRHVVFDEHYFPYKKITHHNTASPTKHVISIFDSWLPHNNPIHVIETEPQTSNPPCSSPISVIPLLIPDSSTLTNPPSHQHDNQQLRTPFITNTSVFEPSLDIPHNNIENSPSSAHTQPPQIQARQTQQQQAHTP